uniref:CapA family protein n=1 Tax=Mesoflavibacter zeaxanthinifaciens TaxID=393060 RepID=UPI003A94C961
MKTLITGDLFISDSFQGQDLIDSSVKALFETSDYRIVNLETPITADSPKNKIQKTGPHLRTSDKTIIPYLKHLKVDMVTLANNHILDYGEKGLTDTFAILGKEKINFLGAGKNLNEAAKPFIIEKDSIKIAIINFAENEWANATETTAGANPMDVIENARQIQKTKLKADYVFVIVHGGNEYYNLPSPRVQEQYRFYAEQGADIVIGHHTHCISGFENYQGTPIYYSLGNFLFTRPSFYEDWYTGLALEVEIINDKLTSKLHVIKQDKVTYRLTLVTGKIKEVVLNRILSYNNIIANKLELIQKWNIFVQSKYTMYLYYWSPLTFVNNRYLKALIRKLGLKLKNKKGMALYLNLMKCEAHNDISKEVIRKYL